MADAGLIGGLAPRTDSLATLCFRFSEIILTPPPNQWSYPRRSASIGGAYASPRHAGRDAVAATMSSRRAMSTGLVQDCGGRNRFACVLVRGLRGRRSRVVLIPRRWYHALMRKHHAQWWPKSPAHQGEHV